MNLGLCVQRCGNLLVDKNLIFSHVLHTGKSKAGFVSEICSVPRSMTSRARHMSNSVYPHMTK